MRRRHKRRGGALHRACCAYIAFLRRHCLCELPDEPLEPGATAPLLPLDPQRAGALVAVAARQAAAGSQSVEADALPSAVVWSAGAQSLLVLLDTLTVGTADGLVTVRVDVACDEVSDAAAEPATRIEIDFVVGTEQRPTGLLAAATPPRGPQLVVDLWGEALVAFAWQALLDTAAGLTANAGTDKDGAGLLPTAWTASSGGIAIRPQARHGIDRRPTTAVER
jgi:hypothetical protein